MPTNFMEGYDLISMSPPPNMGENLMNFPSYPVLFQYLQRTKYILAHPHGIEHHAIESGRLSKAILEDTNNDPLALEPGTFLHWKAETTVDRGGHTVDIENLYPFTAGIPYGGSSADGDKFTIDFTHASLGYDENAATRFRVGQHLWALDFTDSTAVPKDLGLVTEINTKNNTINVENDYTSDDEDTIIYVAEEDDNGTFPTIIGISLYFAGPTQVPGQALKISPVFYVKHAYIDRRLVTYYGDILTRDYPEGVQLLKKVRLDLPMINLMW
jgi:hypothetical protein